MAFDYRDTLVHLAEELLAEGSPWEALYHLQRLIENYPSLPESYLLAARGLRLVGCSKAAGVLFECGLWLLPHHRDPVTALLSLLDEPGPQDAAIDILLRAQEAHPNEGIFAAVLGRMLLIRGSIAAGLSALEEAVVLAPADAAMLTLYAEALLEQGHLSEAWRHAKRAVVEVPSDPHAVAVFAELIARRRNPGAGARLLDLFRDFHGEHQVCLERQERLVRLGTPGPEDREAECPTEVVFVADRPRARHGKIAAGLKAAGWRTVLLYETPPTFDVANAFHEAIRYSDPWEAVVLANTFAPRAFHLATSWSERAAVALVRQKPGRTVYDCYDLVAGIRRREAELQVPDQRFCLEHADGLCCRGLAVRWLERRLRYELPRQRILFQDYCPDTFELSARIGWDGHRDIHVVSSGAMDVEKLGAVDGGLLEVGEILARQRIHLHIYPSPSQVRVDLSDFDELFSDYLDMARRIPFLHMHRPVPETELIRELSQYDVGMHVSITRSRGKPLRGYEPEFARLGSPARIFDFIEAGLPVILNAEFRFAFRVLRPFGLVLNGDMNTLLHLREALKTLLTADLPERIRRARIAYAMPRHVPRLIAFYEGLGDS